jgi:MoaA/NifB/PqqE/SkfB family radical SAM enzyme
MLILAKEFGIRDIDFSGGEPTLRKDFPTLLEQARELGFRRICVITNGIRLSDAGYFRELAGSGLNEILLSLHGHNAQTHERLVGVPGAFSRIMDTLAHAKDLGLRLRINTVVTRYNHQGLADLGRISVAHRPAAHNFICFNDWVNASPVTKDIAIKYSEVVSSLLSTLEVLEEAVPKVSVRYIPFCFLRGKEKHICGLLQNDYDQDEWIDSVKRLITDQDPARRSQYYAFLNRTWVQNRDVWGSYLSQEEISSVGGLGVSEPFNDFGPPLALIAHKVERYAKRKTYVKNEACKGCSRMLICDGLEESYAKVFSTAELHPIPGELIRDPMFFRREYLSGKE